MWSTDLCDLHDLDRRKLASFDVSSLVYLAIGTVTNNFNQLKYTSGILQGQKKKKKEREREREKMWM